MTLTREQADILAVILRHRDTHGATPSAVVIAARLSLPRLTVRRHIAALVSLGVLERGSDGVRPAATETGDDLAWAARHLPLIRRMRVRLEADGKIGRSAA